MNLASAPQTIRCRIMVIPVQGCHRKSDSAAVSQAPTPVLIRFARSKNVCLDSLETELKLFTMHKWNIEIEKCMAGYEQAVLPLHKARIPIGRKLPANLIGCTCCPHACCLIGMPVKSCRSIHRAGAKTDLEMLHIFYAFLCLHKAS